MEDIHPAKRSRAQFLRALIGVLISISGAFIFIAYCLAVPWVILERNYFMIGLMISLVIYQYFFAKKNKTFIRFLNWFEPLNYFRNTSFESEEQVSTQGSMVCVHPHGIYALGLLMNLNKYLIDIPALGSRFVLCKPVLGLIYKWWGIENVNKENFQMLCEKNQSFTFVPGGFEEGTLTSKQQDRVFLKSRKGFIKYGLQYGYKVHPMYTFNENQLFNTVGDAFLEQRIFLNRFKFLSTIFWSKYFIFFPDPNVDLHTVVGKGLQLPKIENPTKDDVNKYHALYIEAVKSLFQRYKDKYSVSKMDLAIF